MFSRGGGGGGRREDEGLFVVKLLGCGITQSSNFTWFSHGISHPGIFCPEFSSVQSCHNQSSYFFLKLFYGLKPRKWIVREKYFNFIFIVVELYQLHCPSGQDSCVLLNTPPTVTSNLTHREENTCRHNVTLYFISFGQLNHQESPIWLSFDIYMYIVDCRLESTSIWRSLPGGTAAFSSGRSTPGLSVWLSPQSS